MGFLIWSDGLSPEGKAVGVLCVLFLAGCCASAAHVFLTKQPDEEEPGAAGVWVPPDRSVLTAVTLAVSLTSASCLAPQPPVFIQFLLFADGFSAVVTAADSIMSRKSRSRSVCGVSVCRFPQRVKQLVVRWLRAKAES